MAESGWKRGEGGIAEVANCSLTIAETRGEACMKIGEKGYWKMLGKSRSGMEQGSIIKSLNVP